MKQLRNYINIRKGKSTVKATDETIKKIVKDELDRLGHDADLNHIDVSEVTDLYCLFNCDDDDYLGPKYKDLNPDISKWNVSNVESMYCAFWKCESFNQDISQWDVSNVSNMQCMFYNCENFNCDLSSWDVSKVKYMRAMFFYCENFSQDISMWNISKVVDHDNMFDGCPIKEEYKPHFVK